MISFVISNSELSHLIIIGFVISNFQSVFFKSRFLFHLHFPFDLINHCVSNISLVFICLSFLLNSKFNPLWLNPVILIQDNISQDVIVSQERSIHEFKTIQELISIDQVVTVQDSKIFNHVFVVIVSPENTVHVILSAFT